MNALRLLSLLAAIAAVSGTILAQSDKTTPGGPHTRPPQPRVTFVELGSVKCVPCRQMQPVMKAIEEKYGDQVQVVFHDVWTDEGSSRAEEYKIRLIPTQVFLDEKGKEFFRHEGFYPEADIHKLLRKRGLKPIRSGS